MASVGLTRLFFLDQRADKAACLDAIDAVSADPEAPGHREAVAACLSIIESRVAGLRFQGKGTPQMLLALLQSQLGAGNKQGAAKVVSNAILDRRPRSVARLAPLLLVIGCAWLLYQWRGPLLAVPWLKALLGLAVGVVVLLHSLKAVVMFWAYGQVLRNPHLYEVKAHQDRLQEILRAADNPAVAEMPIEAEARYLRISELAREFSAERDLERRWITAASEMLAAYSRRPDVEMLGCLLADAEVVLSRPDASPAAKELADQVRNGATARMRI